MPQAMPPKVAAASREDLQKMLVDTLRKLKRGDKRLAELKAENEALQARSADGDTAAAHSQDTQVMDELCRGAVHSCC